MNRQALGSVIHRRVTIIPNGAKKAGSIKKPKAHPAEIANKQKGEVQSPAKAAQRRVKGHVTRNSTVGKPGIKN